MYGYGIGAICSVICPIQADFYEKCSVWREARVALGSDMSGGLRETGGKRLTVWACCEASLLCNCIGGCVNGASL